MTIRPSGWPLRRRHFLYLLGGATLGALTGCGTGEPQYTIEMARDDQFTPASLSVPLGATVAWVNVAERVHTVTTTTDRVQIVSYGAVPEGVSPWHSGDIYTGERWQYTFTQAGRYTYYCRYHAAEGMIGTVTVMES